MKKANIFPILSFSGLYDNEVSFEEVLSLYMDFIYACDVFNISGKGSIDVSKVEKRSGFVVPGGNVFFGKVRYFADSLAIGSERFICDVDRRLSSLNLRPG